MEFPTIENAEQARVLGLMMSELGLEMLMTERELLVRRIQDAGEHGDEAADNRIHLIDIACTEYVRNAALTRRNIYRLHETEI